MITNDFIEIKNLEVYAHHGVLEAEKQLGQKFYIDAKLFFNVELVSFSDEIDESVDYAKVIRTIQRMVSQQSANLIESVAESVVYILLYEYPKIQRIDFNIRKPSAPIDASFDYVGVSISRSRHKAYVALGSNVGDREDHLNNAIEKINEYDRIMKIKKISSFYNTAPVGYVDQPDFLNAVIEIETYLEPEGLLYLLHKIEDEEGRERTVHWGPRTLDLDIILFDDMIINTTNLKIPHPEMTKRDFVLVPLCEIAPYAIHPLTNKYIKELKEEHEHNSSN